MRKLLIFCVTVSLCHYVTAVSAQDMTSGSYKIRMGNFNMTSGTKTSNSYSLTDTVGQTVAQQFDSTGYSIRAGFQYLYTLYDFSFIISDLSIDFGSLPLNTFVTGTNTLTVSAPGQGYSITVAENTRLKNGAHFIPDTTCDSGTCDETTAEVWTTPTNNGFGYNINGNDVPATFATTSHFRPFPDISATESPATVMTTTSAGKNRVATVTYKVAIGATQAAGDYSNQIIYIATPAF